MWLAAAVTLSASTLAFPIFGGFPVSPGKGLFGTLGSTVRHTIDCGVGEVVSGDHFALDCRVIAALLGSEHADNPGVVPVVAHAAFNVSSVVSLCGSAGECTRDGAGPIPGIGGRTDRFPRGKAEVEGSLTLSRELTERIAAAAAAEIAVATEIAAFVVPDELQVVSTGEIEAAFNEKLGEAHPLTSTAAVDIDCGRLEIPVPVRAARDVLRHVPVALWQRVPGVPDGLDPTELLGALPDFVLVVEFDAILDGALEVHVGVAVQTPLGLLPLPRPSQESLKIQLPPEICPAAATTTVPQSDHGCVWLAWPPLLCP